MKKILFFGAVGSLFALDASAMLSGPSLEAETPVTKVLKYNELSELQRGMLRPIPTKEVIELAYSPEALGFLGGEEGARTWFDRSENLFQAQFFNVFSAEDANRVAREAFSAHQSGGLIASIVRRFSRGPTFQTMNDDVLRSLFCVGFWSLADNPEKQENAHLGTGFIRQELSNNNQSYFDEVMHYLYRTVLETLNYERFKRSRGLKEKIRRVNDLFSRYGVVDTTNVENPSTVRARRQSFVLDGYKTMFAQEELEDLRECSSETRKDALVIRSADMSAIAAMKVVETEKKVNTLEKQLKKDREVAQGVITDLQDQIKVQKEQLEEQKEETNVQKEKNQSLEERIAALEAAAVKKLHEEKTQRLTESQKKPMLQEESRVEGIREKQILADYGDANVEKSFYLSKLHYEGGVKSINGELFAEGSGHFKADSLFIKGNFLQNRLDLSNVEISTQSRNFVIGLYMSGYFSMEKIKNFQYVDYDRKRKKALFKMPDGSKYIFSPNLIQYVTPDGQISNFVPEE